MRKILSVVTMAAASLLMACSSGDNKPSSSPILREGRISIYNQTTISIRLMEFTQERMGEQLIDTLNIKIFPRQHYYLKNKIDGGNTDIFPGGDKVWVKFKSEAYDPEHPGNPLFENTIALIVNGNNTVTVKSGGDYSIGPE